MCGSMVHIQSAWAEIMRVKEKKERKKEEEEEEEKETIQDENIMCAYATRGGHNYFKEFFLNVLVFLF